MPCNVIADEILTDHPDRFIPSLAVDPNALWGDPVRDALAAMGAKGLKAIDVHDPYPFQGPQQALKYTQLAGEGSVVERLR